MKKNIEAKITLTADEKLFFVESAKKEGLSVSNFLRKKLGMPFLKKADNFTTNNHNKKFDPAKISKFKNPKEAMLATGISYASYSRLKKLYKNDFDSPQKNKFDPAKISKYKDAKEAELATGISRYYYMKLKKMYVNDFVWP